MFCRTRCLFNPFEDHTIISLFDVESQIFVTMNSKTASRSFSATSRLFLYSPTYISDRSNAEITHSTLIFTAVTSDTATAENHATRPAKSHDDRKCVIILQH